MCGVRTQVEVTGSGGTKPGAQANLLNEEKRECEREIRKSKLNRASLAISGRTLGDLLAAHYWKQSSPQFYTHLSSSIC